MRRWEGGEVGFWAPRDDTEGGTWIGVNDEALVAAITNLSRDKAEDGRASRGHLVSGCLSRPTVAAARAFLDEELSGAPRNPCQILLLHGSRAEVCVIRPEGHRWETLSPGTHVLSNLHDTDEIAFELPGDFGIDHLKPILSDRRKSLPRDFAVEQGRRRARHRRIDADRTGQAVLVRPGKPDEVAYERVAYP